MLSQHHPSMFKSYGVDSDQPCASQMKALARQGEWQAALKLFERMRAFAAQRSQAKESGAQGRTSGRSPNPGRDPPRGLLGSDAAPDDVSYMQAALICERQQLWDAVLKLQADAEAAGVRSTPRMLEAVLHAAEQLSVWSAADQVLLPANSVSQKSRIAYLLGVCCQAKKCTRASQAP